MMAQVAGEADIVFKDQISKSELEGLEPEQIEAARQAHAANQVSEQAEDLIRRVQGQRSSRLLWDNVDDLRAKDQIDRRNGTPRNIRKRKNQLLDKYFSIKAPRLSSHQGE